MGISATHRRKVWRDVWSRKGRTALVSISIFVGVLGVVTLMTVNDLFVSQLEEDLKPSEIAMFNAWVGLPSDVDPASVDNAAVVTSLQSYPSVTDAQAWWNGRVYWKEADDESFIESDLRSPSAPIEQMKIETATLIEGTFPVDGAKEIAVERRMAERYGFEVGDVLTIRVLSELQADGTIPEETWTISGIMFQPYIFNGPSTMYAPQDAIHYLSDVDAYSFFQVRFDHLPTFEEAQSFEAYIKETTPYEIYFSDLNDPDNSDFIEEIRQWGNTLTILSILAMLVASFLVVTIINSILTEQRRQIGVMKSLGASRLDNFTIFTSLAFVYGLIGTIPAIVLGIPAGYMLTQALAPLANVYIPGFSVSVISVVVGLVMGLGVPVIASCIPIYRGTRVSILSAMTDLGLSSNYGHGVWVRFINWLPVLPTIRQGLANLSQQKGRYFLTGLTLTLAAGAFMGVSAVFISMGNVIDTAFSTYNLAVIAHPDSHQDYDEVSQLILASMENVKAVQGAYSSELDVVKEEPTPTNDNMPVPPPPLPDLNQSIYINGFDPQSDIILLDLLEGEAWNNDSSRSGIVLTETASKELHKGLGDTITLTLDGRTLALEVIGIDKFPFSRGFMRWDELARFVENTEEVSTDTFWLQLKDDNATTADADKTIAELRELLLSKGITANFSNQIAQEEENSQTILTVGLVFNIASGVMAAIGAIGLLASLSISVYERQREIGVMRSVGATTLNIAGQFLTEGLLVGLIAWAISIPLSVGISVILGDVLPIDIEVSYPPMVIGLGLGGAVIVAFVASLYPSIIASRKTVSDILRYQ